MTGKEFLMTLAGSVAALLTGLFEKLFGSAVRRPLLGEITGADLAVVACLLGLILLVNGLIASVLRRKIRAAEARPEPAGWQGALVNALGKPLYLLVWIYGLYFAAGPLLVKVASDDGVHPVTQFLDRLFDLALFVALFWFFFRFTRVIEARLQFWAAKSETRWDDLLVPLLGKSLRVILPVIAVILALPVLGLSAEYSSVVSRISSLLIIAAVSWILFQSVSAGEKLVLSRFDIKQADNLQARKVYTQVHVLGKTLYVLIGIFTVASVLMMFEEVRRLGTSILASAGVIGIIVGFAAQRTIANLFAGFQLAMTQPIRIDDVVIVENEWGRIEEITLTYIVVRIWDERRLVVPLSYFIEKPFQNWTRVTSQLLGSVFVYADYTLPIEELRPVVKGIVEASPLWDRRFWNVQVTDSTERSVQIRVLATASDASKAWELRCDIREKLIRHIQQHHPQSLPKVRADYRGGELSGGRS